MMINSDDDLNAALLDADERTMPVAAQQAQTILGLEEEGWPHRQGDVMALISCE